MKWIKTIFKNEPSRDTPIKAAELNKFGDGIEEAHEGIERIENTAVNEENFKIKFEVVDNQPRLRMEKKI